MRNYNLYKYPSKDVESFRKKHGLSTLNTEYRLYEADSNKGDNLIKESSNKQELIDYVKKVNGNLKDRGRFHL